MGNRAVITTEPYRVGDIGIYVHWNGGQESIEGFLAAAKELGYRCPTSDCYGMARLAQLIGNFFGGELSLGIDVNKKLDTDNGDNGTWLIGPDWTLAGRRFAGSHSTGTLDAADRAKADKIRAECVHKTRAAEAATLTPRVEQPEDI